MLHMITRCYTGVTYEWYDYKMFRYMWLQDVTHDTTKMLHSMLAHILYAKPDIPRPYTIDFFTHLLHMITRYYILQQQSETSVNFVIELRSLEEYDGTQ